MYARERNQRKIAVMKELPGREVSGIAAGNDKIQTFNPVDFGAGFERNNPK
jgi:hypothetical protein